MSKVTHCGYVAILGRPNVGKSTLLNQLIGQKISIMSRKPQTTRHRILGIKTFANTQIIYVDTPGLHQEVKSALNRYLNRAALSAIHDVDVIVWMVEALRWQDDDEWVLSKLAKATCPIILVVNKVDLVPDKTKLLPFITKLQEKLTFAAVVPISATKDINCEKLEELLTHYLPEGPWLFPADQLTDRNERFLAAEVIREKLLLLLGQEVPYALTVSIDEYKQEAKILRISATIWVEKTGQKAIVIGAGGEKLKEVGKRARLELEKSLGQKIFLQLWVKVRRNWSDDERALQSLGYGE